MRNKINDIRNANLPAGIELTLVTGQPVTLERAVSAFTEALFVAIGIVLAVSLAAEEIGRLRDCPPLRHS